MTELEFVTRYTGTPMEHRPYLRGCFGDCEAMGYFPTPDPREWPVLARPWPAHPEVGDEMDAPEHGLRLVYVGPDWYQRGEARLVDEPDDKDYAFALAARGWWVPSTAVDDGWAFLKCPECNGFGTVSYWKGLSRLPLLWGRALRSVWHADGWEGWPPEVPHRRARTHWFYFAWGVKETWRAITWRTPEVLR